MSYEGYVEKLCKNGHYWMEDAYMESNSNCSECFEPCVWHHNVDSTNGEIRGCPETKPYPLRVKRYETRMVEVRVPVYRVPRK